MDNVVTIIKRKSFLAFLLFYHLNGQTLVAIYGFFKFLIQLHPKLNKIVNFVHNSGSKAIKWIISNRGLESVSSLSIPFLSSAISFEKKLYSLIYCYNIEVMHREAHKKN